MLLVSERTSRLPACMNVFFVLQHWKTDWTSWKRTWKRNWQRYFCCIISSCFHLHNFLYFTENFYLLRPGTSLRSLLILFCLLGDLFKKNHHFISDQFECSFHQFLIYSTFVLISVDTLCLIKSKFLYLNFYFIFAVCLLCAFSCLNTVDQIIRRASRLACKESKNKRLLYAERLKVVVVKIWVFGIFELLL